MGRSPTGPQRRRARLHTQHEQPWACCLPCPRRAAEAGQQPSRAEDASSIVMSHPAASVGQASTLTVAAPIAGAPAARGVLVASGCTTAQA